MKIYICFILSLLLLQSSNLFAQLPSKGKNKGAYSAFKNAERKFYKGNLKGGEATFERAASRYENNGDPDGYIAAKAMEAIVLLNKDRPKEAFRAFRHAEELYDEQGKHNEATRAYLRLCLGKYHLYYNEQKEATAFLEEAEKVADKNPEYVSPIFNIELQQTLGELYLKKGDKQTALGFYESLIEAANNLPPEDQNQDFLNQLKGQAGDLVDDVLGPGEAAGRYTDMLNNADSSKLGELSFKAGRSFYKYTEYETAYAHLEKALEFDMPPEERAETQSMLATIAMSIKDYQDALEQNGAALALQIEIGGSARDIYDGLLKQGTICKELEITGKSLYWYKKTVKNIKENWTLEEELVNYDLEPMEHLGNPSLNENFNIALLNYERAERLIAKLPSHEQDVARIEVFMAKGHLYFTARNYAKARDFYFDALGLMSDVYPEKHALVAECTRYLSEIEGAEKNFEEALEYINRSINASLKEGVDDISGYNLPNPKDGAFPYELLHSVITKSSILYGLYSHGGNATEEELLRSLDDSDLAMEMLVHLRASYRTEGAKYELSELSERINHQAIQTSSSLYAINPKDEYVDHIFKYIENSKSALLLQAVQQLRAQKVSRVPEWVIEKENKLKVNIAYLSGEIYYEAKQGKDMDKKRMEALEEELVEAQEKYPEYLDYIEKTYPEYYDMKYKQKPVECRDLQKRMGAEEVIINYVVVDSFIHIMLINKEQVVYTKAGTPPRIGRSILKYISSLKGEKPDVFLKYSNIWYDVLVAPIIEHLDGRDMVIIPDGELNYLPFELIPTAPVSQSMSKGKKDYNMYKEVPYLLRKGAIAYNYSATLYLDAKEHDYSNVPEGFMGFAPDFSDVKSFDLSRRHQKSKYADLLLSPLENAALEVQMIGDLTQGSTLVGGGATESAFKEEAQKFGVLHFATHGILNHKYPLYSSLVLLADEKEDGLLHTYELYNMSLNAELVALSACNTGVGTIKKGEGAMSVARGFAYAGCPNIAMTLWPVSDQATQILMENFYTYLMQGMPKAKALQKAKLNFLDSGDGLICVPFFWSGLILVGTPDKLSSLQVLSEGVGLLTWLGIAGGILLFVGIILFFIKKRN